MKFQTPIYTRKNKYCVFVGKKKPMRFALLYFEVKELWGIGPVNTFFFFLTEKSVVVFL